MGIAVPLRTTPPQAALHYRAVGGSDRAAGWKDGDPTNSQRDYSTSGVIYPYSETTLIGIIDGTSNTMIFGETSSALAGRLALGAGAAFNRGHGGSTITIQLAPRRGPLLI